MCNAVVAAALIGERNRDGDNQAVARPIWGIWSGR